MAVWWGLAAAIGIPVVVGVLAVVWPERVARGESVCDIQARVEREQQQDQAIELGRLRRGSDPCATDRFPRMRPATARPVGRPSRASRPMPN